MLHHLALCSRDLAAATLMYDKLLLQLGYHRFLTNERVCGWIGAEPEILIYAARDPTVAPHRLYNPGIHHVAFCVNSCAEVDLVHDVALRARFRILESPKFYPSYSATYYAVFFEDLDGIKLEVVLP